MRLGNDADKSTAKWLFGIYETVAQFGRAAARHKTGQQDTGSSPVRFTNSPWTPGQGGRVCEAQFDSANRRVRVPLVPVQYHTL